VFAAQKEFLDALEQINEHWFARAKSEAEFANAMADKLAAARSMPDMTIVYQDWFGQRVQRYVEDSNHILADLQKLMRTGTRLLKTARAAAEAQSAQLANRSGLRAARQISHWRRHGGSAFGEKMSE